MRLNFQRLDDGSWGVKSHVDLGHDTHPSPGDEVDVPRRDGSESRVRLGAQVAQWNGGRSRVFRIHRDNGNGERQERRRTIFEISDTVRGWLDSGVDPDTLQSMVISMVWEKKTGEVIE
jgi:hypothetical protein